MVFVSKIKSNKSIKLQVNQGTTKKHISSNKISYNIKIQLEFTSQTLFLNETRKNYWSTKLRTFNTEFVNEVKLKANSYV